MAFLQKVNENLEILELSDKEKIEQRNKDKNFFFNLGLIIDHHPEGAPSTSGMLFKLLSNLGMFDNLEEIKSGDKKKIREMAEFIDIVDSQGFQAMGHRDHFQKSDRTILGLNRFISFKNLWKFFKYTDGNYARELSDEELKKFGLIYTDKSGKIINRQEQQRKVINTSNEKLKEFKEKGYIIDSKFGKIVVDVNGQLTGGAIAAQSVEDGYLKWDSKNKTLFMFANKELDKNLFDCGDKIRKYLWVTQAGREPTGLTLKKVIEKIGGVVEKESELEKYLNEE